MTIECRCAGCGGRFRMADEAAGQRVQCPRCATMILLPTPAKPARVWPPTARTPSVPKPTTPPRPAAAAEPPWLVRTADDRQHGPMAKQQLDQLVAQGRLDAFCEVRRADWDAWRMIEEVYPALAMDDAQDDLLTSAADSDSSTRSAVGQPSRVWPCPDCGQTVSRRATACPHCGCPLAERTLAQPPVQPPPVPPRPEHSGARETPRNDHPRPASSDAQVRAGGRLARRIAFLAAAIVLLVAAVVAAGVYLGIQIRNRVNRAPLPVEPAAPSQPAAPSPAPAPSPPPAQPLSAEQLAKCKQEVAAAMAREVDNAYRTKHDLMAALQPLGDYAEALKMAQEMADPRAKPSDGKDTPKQKPGASQPYQSQFEALQRDCRDYLDAHLTEPVDRQETVWSVGRDWVKMRLPEQRLLEDLLRSNPPPPDTR